MGVQRVLLKPAEVAAMFGVAPKTVNLWARAGRVRSVRTIGGHLRFYADDVEAVLAQNTAERAPTGAPVTQAQVGMT